MEKYERFSADRVLAVSTKYLLSYHRGAIRLYDKLTGELLDKVVLFKGIKSIRPVERLLRGEPRTAVVVDDETFVFAWNGDIYRYEAISNKIEREYKAKKDIKSPLAFCIRRNADENNIWFGEYGWNQTKGEMSILKRTNTEWEKVFSFPEKTVTHIHNIVYDEYRSRFIILTGDSDEESGIWEANEDFSKVTPIVRGKQIYRACVAFPATEGVYYATDTPLEQNYVFLLAEGENETCVKKICELPGPCIYGRKSGEIIYIATSVEPDSSLSDLRYRFTYKLGKGVKNRYVHVIAGNEQKGFTELLNFKKDIMPMWLFQFGNAYFADTCEDDDIYISPVGTGSTDGKTFVLKNERHNEG